MRDDDDKKKKDATYLIIDREVTDYIITKIFWFGALYFVYKKASDRGYRRGYHDGAKNMKHRNK